MKINKVSSINPEMVAQLTGQKHGAASAWLTKEFVSLLWTSKVVETA